MGTLDTWLSLAPKPEPLAKGMEWNVFLSYRSVNRAWVITLYDVLRAHGHKVFLDQCVLAAGDRLIGSLEKALSKSQAGVLIWSSAAADSEWVEREYEVMEARAGADKVFHFVPTRLDATELPLFARARIFLDFSQYPDGPNGGELLRLLHAVVGKPLSEAAAHFALEQDEAARAFTAKVKAAVQDGRAADLERLFGEGGMLCETSSALGCAAAEGLTKLKAYDAALNMLATLSQRFPRAIRPKQLQALALARRGGPGDLDRAQEIVGELYAAGERDPETVGIYARTWMDRYEASQDRLDLERSRDLYAQAFEAAPDDYYTGINAAAKSVFLATPEDVERARASARGVQTIVGTKAVPGNYWKTATVAEVHLILAEYAAAGARYGEAVKMAHKEIGSHESTWKQARRLMRAMGSAEEEVATVRKAFAHLNPQLLA